MYLVDGAQNINRMDGGYALKLPVEAIAEFRILTQSAPPEYGGTGGATTSVVTRSGAQPVPRRPVRVPAQRCLRRAELLFRERRAAAAAPVRRHDRRPDHQGSAAVLRVLRRLPQHARGDHDRHGAHPAGASGRLFRNGDAAHQLRGRGDADPRKHHSRRGDQPGLAQCHGALSARQRVTVHLSSHARRQQRARFGRRPRRFHRVAERPDLRPLLVLRRPQHQSDLGPGHRRAGLPDARRHLDPRRHDVEHAHLLAVAHEFAARHRAAPRLLLRSAPEPDAAERARVRLRLVERSRSGAAVLQHQRLHADWRRDHGSSQHDAEHLRDPGQPRVDERLAPREGRRRDPAHRDRHDPGDCAECVLRVRRHVPHEQRHREPAARLPGDLLSGAGRFQPGDPALERRRVRAGRMARRPAGHAELRPSLRAHQPVHGDRGSPERLRAGREVAGQARRACRAVVSGRSGNREGDRAELRRVHAPRRRGLGSDRAPASGR